MRHVKTIWAGLIGIGLVGAVGSAQAILIGGSYNVDVNDLDPGLVVETSDLYDNPFTFELVDVGDTLTVDLFKIWTDETWVNPDDREKIEGSVYWAFTSPSPAGGSSTGITYGASYVISQKGVLEWDSPATITFGDGSELKITLTDELFNWGFGGLKEGEGSGATVQATFELASLGTGSVPGASVPEPAALGLFGFGLAAVGLARRRRRETPAAG